MTVQRRVASTGDMLGTPLEARMYIGGRWVESLSGQRYETRSPATGRVVATVPQGTREDAQEAIRAARASQWTWASTSLGERVRLCRRIAEVIRNRREELAWVIATEQGKPYHTEARMEAQQAAVWYEMAAEDAMMLETAVLPVANPAKRAFTIRQPRGVYAVVTPWNFPVGIPSQLIGPAFVTGNTVVWVPAPTTSACAAKLTECLEEAGVAAGVVNLVTGPGPVVGDEIVANPGTDAVAFVGSSATGQIVAQHGAGKPMLLELGGNGPTVVLADADLDLAVPRVAVGCTRNAGQVCNAVGRILVHRSLHDEFAGRLAQILRGVRLGDPFDEQTTMGPMHHEPTVAKVDEQLADACERGARILLGGSRAPGFPTRLFYLPTVVAGVSAESRLHLEETFGPVAALIPFDDEEQALQYADASPYGLSGAVFTRDVLRGIRLAERLRLGLVNINDNSYPADNRIPTGGASGKRSGIGRRRGAHSLIEMTDLKTIVLDIG